ncbi:MAG: carboxypeptidase-like regulatory domain-containing protein [Flavobacteriaceae bacterium]|nr:carboxypeptidase-like regulatory domain-containing protein [Flavobacteriaceae bacterium]
MKCIFYLIFFISYFSLMAQEQSKLIKGFVENEITEAPMLNVHVINLSRVIGTITNQKGEFEIEASVNDTLYFSYVGYKPLKVSVTGDMIKFGKSKFRLTGLAFALEEIILRPYQLTGYLEIDAKKVPINSSRRYSISGLSNSGYEAGNRNKGAISRALGALFNPVDFLNNLFGKNPKQLRKLKQMRADDEIKNLLVSKFDREVLVQLLGIKKIDLEEIIRNCNYSDSFIKESNDLQVLEAISSCYEEFRILQGTQ